MKSLRRLALSATALVVIAAAAACQGKGTHPGTPVAGTLADAAAGYAPLTQTGSQAFGGGFAFHATLGSAAIATTSSPWICYAPDPANGYQNYDLDGTDNTTYGLFISVDPSEWSKGPHTIDGVKVSILVAAPDRYGVATNGTLVLDSAGTLIDTAGSGCAFHTSGGTPIFGEING